MTLTFKKVGINEKFQPEETQDIHVNHKEASFVNEIRSEDLSKCKSVLTTTRDLYAVNSITAPNCAP